MEQKNDVNLFESRVISYFNNLSDELKNKFINYVSTRYPDKSSATWRNKLHGYGLSRLNSVETECLTLIIEKEEWK